MQCPHFSLSIWSYSLFFFFLFSYEFSNFFNGFNYVIYYHTPKRISSRWYFKVSSIAKFIPLISHLLLFLFILFSSLLSLLYIPPGAPLLARGHRFGVRYFQYFHISLCRHLLPLLPQAINIRPPTFFFPRLLSLLFILTIKTVSIRHGFVQAVEACLPIWGRRILCPTPHSSNLHLSIHRT